MPAWLDRLRAMPVSGSGYDSREWIDTAAGIKYSVVTDWQGQAVGYASAPAVYAPGQLATAYDLNGNVLTTYAVESPADPMGTVVLMMIAAMAAGAALVGTGVMPASSFTFGEAATAGGTASAANAPLLSKAALDGTTAFGANSVAGAYELGADAFLTEAAAGTVATTTATATAAATAGAGTLTSALGGAATLATKVIGTASALLGIKSANAGTVSGSGSTGAVTTAPSQAAGGGMGTALFLAGALGLVAYVWTRK